jgi:hypothetical protein
MPTGSGRALLMIKCHHHQQNRPRRPLVTPSRQIRTISGSLEGRQVLYRAPTHQQMPGLPLASSLITVTKELLLLLLTCIAIRPFQRCRNDPNLLVGCFGAGHFASKMKIYVSNHEFPTKRVSHQLLPANCELSARRLSRAILLVISEAAAGPIFPPHSQPDRRYQLHQSVTLRPRHSLHRVP